MMVSISLESLLSCFCIISNDYSSCEYKGAIQKIYVEGNKERRERIKEVKKEGRMKECPHGYNELLVLKYLVDKFSYVLRKSLAQDQNTKELLTAHLVLVFLSLFFLPLCSFHM